MKPRLQERTASEVTSSDEIEGRTSGKEDTSFTEMVIEDKFEQVSCKHLCKMVNLTASTSALSQLKTLTES